MAEPLSDPRTYFKFQSCGRCFYKPCDGLRYGGVIAGKILFVHNSHLGLGFFDCPFTVQAFDEIERLTEGLSSSELDSRLSDAYGLMTPAQILQYRMDDYIADYSDFGGRIAFIKTLWDDQVISILRIPLFFTADPKMRKWLYANENLMYSLKKTIVDDGLSGAAVTDSMAGAAQDSDGQDAGDDQHDDDSQDDDQDTSTDGTFNVRLNIDPNDPDSQQDTFTLYSTDQAQSYSQKLTIKDDQVPGDSFTDLGFTGLDTSLSYSMKIDLGKDNNSYFLFEDKAYGELHG
jgi:hypothetical protein